GQWLLEKRPSTGIWGGLWSLPELASEESVVLHIEQRFATQVAAVTPLSSFRHTFSHYHLDISPSQIQITDMKMVREGDKYQWFSQQDAMAQGLPAPVRSILEKID
ncbi:MAG: NUDIX domain-containing protein, partial [Gilvibacter sp.]